MPAPATAASSPRRHGVVVIHGQGDGQSPGDQLAVVANAIADVLEVAGGRVDRAFSVTGQVAMGALDVTPPGGAGPTDRFEFSEAYWAQSLPTASPAAVATWMLRLGPREATHVVRGWWRNAANDQIDDKDGAGGGSDYPARLWLRAAYYAQLTVLSAVVWAIYLLSFLLAPLVFALYSMASPRGSRRWSLLSPVLSALHSVDPFLRGTLGDAWRFVEDGMWSSNIRLVMEERLVALYGDAGIADITVIAHSQGCAIAYDALAEGRAVGAAAAATPRRLTLVTVGSGLNRNAGLSRASRTSPYSRRLGREAIDHRITGLPPNGPLTPAATDEERQRLRGSFFWLDIFARLDLVPGGPVLDQVRHAARIDPCQLKARQVINEDDLLRDHFGYFRNTDLVVPRIIRAVYGGEYPWTGATRTDSPAITSDRVRRRTRAVAFLQALRFTLAATVVALFALVAWSEDVRSVFEQDAGVLIAMDLGRFGEILTLVAVLIAPALIAVSVYRFVRGWWLDDL